MAPCIVVTGMNVKSISESQTSNFPLLHVQVVVFHMYISDMNVYNKTVQEDLGPHWTNSGYQLTSSLDLDANKLAPPYIRRVSIEFITIVLQYIVFISIMSHGLPE